MKNPEEKKKGYAGGVALSKEKVSELAKRGIEVTCSDLCRQYRGLTAALQYLSPVPDENEKSLSTDGTYLFYSPEHVVDAFSGEQKKYNWLQYEYLHIIIHCLFGHVRNKAATVEILAGYENGNEIYDLCADFAADVILEELTGMPRARSGDYFRRARIAAGYGKLQYKLKSRTFPAFVRYCAGSPEMAEGLRQLKRRMTSDSHTWWNAQNHVLPQIQCDSGTGDQWEKLLIQTMADIQNLGLTAASGKRPGNIPGRWAMEVQAESENISSYRELLRHFSEIAELPQREEAEYDWNWYEIGMNLYGNIPILEPAETVEDLEVGELVIALDTSGSCQDLAPRFLRETINLLRDMQGYGGQVRVRILECDTQIQGEIVISGNDEIPELGNTTLNGWGGTSFIPVFQYIEKKRAAGEIGNISGLIYFSDGCGDFPTQAPDYETVFVIPVEGDMDFACNNIYIRKIVPGWVRIMQLTRYDIEELEETG
ncbi:MAG: VWA-like domain-containing protein [Lachnospiraceae bacterium]|nr:VWA-like domain-containing protein [Lachnospiraceae bacterium]